ncbi:MAG: hypothetical protein LBD21_04990 [Tannerellaceae bacterium]|jgi:serine/threonine protein kinase|nr:hypothetical protein [Tannerellaceae bacterium]
MNIEDRLFFGYRIIESIHRSNQYNICRAYNNEGYIVALKIAEEQFISENPELIERAYRKAEVMRAISNRGSNTFHLVRVFDVVKTDKVFFVVMNWIEGVTLESSLPRMSLPRNRVDLEDIENQLHEAVRVVTNMGHRPAVINSSNVIITPRDTVVLLNYIDLARQDETAVRGVVDNFMDECYRELSHRYAVPIAEESTYEPSSYPYPPNDYPPYPKPSGSRLSDKAVMIGFAVIIIITLLTILVLLIVGRQV